MTHTIYSNLTASISELKKDPMGTVMSTHGEPLAILNRNQPVFYCISAQTYENLMGVLEDLEFSKVIKARAHEKEVEVNLDDL